MTQQQCRREAVHLPPPPITSAVDILTVTAMTLVRTVTNSTLSWAACNQAYVGLLQIPAESVRQKRPNFRIPCVRPSKYCPMHNVARGASPLPSTTAQHDSICPSPTLQVVYRDTFKRDEGNERSEVKLYLSIYSVGSNKGREYY